MHITHTQMQPLNKVEEDTDRDRYMSPLEAKEYGIIDHIIGGEEAVFDVKGSTKRFPKVCLCVRVCALSVASSTIICLFACSCKH